MAYLHSVKISVWLDKKWQEMLTETWGRLEGAQSPSETWSYSEGVWGSGIFFFRKFEKVKWNSFILSTFFNREAIL